MDMEASMPHISGGSFFLGSLPATGLRFRMVCLLKCVKPDGNDQNHAPGYILKIEAWL